MTTTNRARLRGLTNPMKRRLAELWWEHPTAGRAAIAALFRAEFGRDISDDAVRRYRPAGLGTAAPPAHPPEPEPEAPPRTRCHGPGQTLTAADKDTIAALWREHPTATKDRIAALAREALGRPLGVSTVVKYMPADARPPRPRKGVPAADPARPEPLRPVQVEVIAGLFRDHPEATLGEIAAMTTRLLGRSVSTSTVARFRPAGHASEQPARPRPKAIDHAYISPLDKLIVEHRAVARRLGIGTQTTKEARA